MFGKKSPEEIQAKEAKKAAEEKVEEDEREERRRKYHQENIDRIEASIDRILKTDAPLGQHVFSFYNQWDTDADFVTQKFANQDYKAISVTRDKNSYITILFEKVAEQ